MGCSNFKNVIQMTSEKFTLYSVPHKPQVIRTREGISGTYLLFDPNTPNWVIVNDLGKEIIEMCDGKRNVSEIVTALCEKYGSTHDESIGEILDFVNELKAKFFLLEDEFPPPKRAKKENANLMNLWINVTNRCNLQCIHCHLSSGLPLKDELTKGEIYRIINEAEELGVKHLVVTGGEPLIRKDALNILDYACQHCDRVVLLTNGTLITEGMAQKLGELNLDIQVSLDGAREETHDFIRGPGSFRKTIEGVQNLVKAGTEPHTSMTIMKKNMNEIPEMVQLLRELGIRYLNLPILQIKGRAKDNKSSIELEIEDMIAVIKTVLEVSKEGDIVLSMEKNLQDKIEIKRKIDLCEAGCSVVSVAADGCVYPCAGLHEKEFYAGNIRKQPLEKIWNENGILNWLRSFSVLDIPECRDCDLKFICGGGCHVDRYHAYERLDVRSPECEVQQMLYWHLLAEKMKKIG